VETFVEKLKEKNVFLQNDMQKTNDRITFHLYTEPDREIYRFTIRTSFNFMDVSIYFQSDFDDARTNIFTYAENELKEFILQWFYKSDCNVLLMDKMVKEHLFHNACDFSAYKEEFGDELKLSISENLFYLEKQPESFKKFCLFSSYITNLREYFTSKDPSYKFSIDFKSLKRHIQFVGYYKGVKFSLYIKITESEISFFKFSREPELFCSMEYSLFDYDTLKRIFEKVLESLYQKNRLRLLSNPPKFYFEELMKRLRNLVSSSMHDLFYHEFSKKRSPDEIEKMCYELLQEQTEVLYTLRSRLDKTFIGCFFFHDYYFVVVKEHVSIESFETFSFQSKEEAYDKYFSLHKKYSMEKISIFSSPLS